jgi:hypothetical protein
MTGSKTVAVFMVKWARGGPSVVILAAGFVIAKLL